MDATFWAFIALVIFMGVVVYFKVPGLIGKSLDERAAKIRNELDEAQRLREEANKLLGEVPEAPQGGRERGRGDIVAAAKREAEALADEAHKKAEEYVTRRCACRAEDRPGPARRRRKSAHRRRRRDRGSARRACSQGDAKAGADLFADLLKAVESKLN